MGTKSGERVKFLFDYLQMVSCFFTPILLTLYISTPIFLTPVQFDPSIIQPLYYFTRILSLLKLRIMRPQPILFNLINGDKNRGEMTEV